VGREAKELGGYGNASGSSGSNRLRRRSGFDGSPGRGEASRLTYDPLVSRFWVRFTSQTRMASAGVQRKNPWRTVVIRSFYAAAIAQRLLRRRNRLLHIFLAVRPLPKNAASNCDGGR